MTFLYASLGILMMSGILFINQYSLLISSKNQNSEFYKSEYFFSKYQQIDKRILAYINSDNLTLGGPNESCYLIKKNVLSKNIFKSDNEYIVSANTKSNHPDIKNSCTLTNGIHRILISRKGNLNNSYKLNSCILKNEEFCSFELQD